MKEQPIILKKVSVHNLQAVDLEIKPGQLVVFTGVSGSGKSSLAFDTIYTEGQRRYVESLSAYARRYVGDMQKPEAEHISGLTPTISIEQKMAGKNPRSTVGTMTQIYDYLRVLFARVAVPHCPISGEAVRARSKKSIIEMVAAYEAGTRLMILAPLVKGRKGTLADEIGELQKKGFMRARIDGEVVDLSEPIELDGSVAHDLDVVVDRVVAGQNRSRLAEAINMALEMGEGVCVVWDDGRKANEIFSMHAFSPKSGLSYAPLEPQDFSFNSPHGMCKTCHGMGTINEFDLDLVIDEEASIAQDCCSIASSNATVRYGNIYRNLARMYDFSVKTPWKKLSKEARDVFLHGTKKKWTRMRFVHPVTKKRWSDYVQWRGVLWEARKRYADATSDAYKKNMQALMRSEGCPDCKGARLAPYPAAAKLGGKTLPQVCSMTIAQAAEFVKGLKLSKTDALIAEELVKEIRERLGFLLDVGLHYLNIDRTSPTLSGGESQRVRLASQIGCGLVGVTYVLDEPSIGLHPRDNTKLLKTLQHLRDRGNTVIVVEHDEETIRAADHIVDVGPLAGVGGGQILVSGTVDDLVANKESITGDYIAGRQEIEIPQERRKGSGKAITITGARHHNLKNMTARFPLNTFIAVTGVSGSGKSSLVLETLHPALSNALHGGEQDVGKHKKLEGIGDIEKVIAIDQSPIGRNPRSNPATYIKVASEIRDLFAQLPESQARGYKGGRFSFNVAVGSCTECKGMGMIKVDMDFLEDSFVTCPLCQGRRFDEETLSVRYRGRNIYDVLEMSVEEALEFFGPIPRIRVKLEALNQVGMGYIRLGQSSTTLSGGEAQRVKLARELSRPSHGKTLYLLDEPTTGLHFHDINALLDVLHHLVDQGNTVLVIEHNMEVIKTADWILDIGPDGGEGGGELVFEGTPEDLAKQKTPTGVATLGALKKHEAKVKPKPKAVLPIDAIEVVGCSQNNLKNVTAKIPRGQITVCTGPSGSGKSSFAFETIYAEGQRRYTESLSPYARQFVKQSPKPKVESVEGLSPAVAIEQKAHAGNPRSTVGTLTEVYDYLRILFARAGTAHCPETGKAIQAISKEHVVDRVLSLPAGDKILVLAPLGAPKQELFERLSRQGFLRVRLDGKIFELDEKIPIEKGRKHKLFLVVDRLKVNPGGRARLFEAIETAAKAGDDQVVVLHNEEEIPYNLRFSVESTGKSYPPITPRTLAFNNIEGMCPACHGLGCTICNEERLAPLGQNVRLEGVSIGQLSLMPAQDALAFVQEVTLDPRDAKLLEEVLSQIKSRLQFLCDVGLHYLSLHRGAPTLSNGEAQRIRLARQLGSGLTGVLYVLDEPTVGLHPHDNIRLNGALRQMKALGNTIVMVEHDPLTVETADHIIDFGPSAGVRGGEICAEGTLEQIKANPNSLTGAYLSGKKTLPRRSEVREGAGLLSVRNAKTHNLQNVSVAFPEGVFTCVTGVSGSGKSTLVHNELLPKLKNPIVLDQNPIGHTARADVGTYCDIMPPIRTFFSQLPHAITRSLKPGAFSYNHRKGMCTHCWGMGYRKVEMLFLPPVRIECEHCKGERLNPISLEVKYQDRNFGQLLQLTVDQAHDLFSNHRTIARRLNMLRAVGLGYLTLGQRIQTLSGGEAQRLKLSRELSKRSKEHTVYLLDEPTTGLHFEDVRLLLDVFDKLLKKGHTLIVIEHNLDIIRHADHIIDMGPGAGIDGGRIIATGTPEEIRNHPDSVTGRYL